jgi:Acyltransferase
VCVCVCFLLLSKQYRLDDPLCWGVLPALSYLESRRIRWTLGASDICFTNPVYSAFFNSGQTIETHRGKGIYQRAVDLAIQKLDSGRWVSPVSSSPSFPPAPHLLVSRPEDQVHIFPEGKVNQPVRREGTHNGGVERHPLLRFHWGVSRILLEAGHHVEIIPMWLQGPSVLRQTPDFDQMMHILTTRSTYPTGFDQIMPETRSFPRFLPRLGARVSVSFGVPVTDRLRPLVVDDPPPIPRPGSYAADLPPPAPEPRTLPRYHQRAVPLTGADPDTLQRPTPPDYSGDPAETIDRRIEIARVLREEVDKLGRRSEARRSAA